MLLKWDPAGRIIVVMVLLGKELWKLQNPTELLPLTYLPLSSLLFFFLNLPYSSYMVR